MAIGYIDSSALEVDLAAREGLVTSSLAVVECRRAVRRAGNRRLLQRAEQVFEAIYLLDLTPPILERAATVVPATLRSLDAIHLATALSVEEDDRDGIADDDRLAEGAKAN